MMPAIAEADVGLLVDVDVPWIRAHQEKTCRPGGAHRRGRREGVLPDLGFASSARVQGDSVLILKQLLKH